MRPALAKSTKFALTLLAAAAFTTAAHAQALDIKGLATDINPCSNFYDFVNSRWVAQTELLPSQPRIGSFDLLRVANTAILERGLLDLAAHPAQQTTPGLKQAAAYFASGMDTQAIEAQGLTALQPLLAQIAALNKAADLPPLLAALAQAQIAAPLATGVQPDPKDTRRYVLGLSQGGLGLPDRDDYFKTDEVSRRLQAAYRVYAGRLLSAANGEAPSEATLDALIAFEARLADGSKPRAALRDPNARYNPFSPAGLAAAAPGFDWPVYLIALTGRPQSVERLIVGQPDFARRVGELAASTPLATWRNYLTMRLLDASASRLPKAFADANFDYREVTIRGVKAAPPRGEQVILTIGGSTGREPIGMALGEVFVSRAFSAEAQARALQLVGDVKAAMQHRIENLTWMSAPTKLRALEKLAAMAPKIGAPEKFPLYEGLALKPDDYAGNLLRTATWASARQMADLDRPVDRTRWSMAPYIVNASAGGLNEITFPAGILQPPFFNAQADDAVNYGGIGMVIGHEITHHFDDNGRNFDAIGTLTDWWTPADASAYLARADKVVALYGGYVPVPGTPINGRLTLGENISDMSGLPIAFEALQTALKRNGKTDKIDGYTPEQRFFLSNALVWRNKIRTEALINQLRTDPHSPGRFRVQGPMSNSPDFARAFSCKPDSAMVAAEPITVW